MSFAEVISFPVLYTPRLCLREIVPADREDYYLLLQGEEVKQSDDWKPVTRVEAEAIIRARQEAFWEQTQIRWGIEALGRSGLAGTIALHSLAEGVSGELGYFVRQDYWGQGYATEAARTVVWFGFAVLELPLIEAYTGVLNSRSVRVLEKLGFTNAGIDPVDSLRAGGDSPGLSYHYRLTQAEYLARQRGQAGITL